MKRTKLKERNQNTEGISVKWLREGFNPATTRTKELPVALPNQSTP